MASDAGAPSPPRASGRAAHTVRLGKVGCREEDFRTMLRAKLTIDGVAAAFGCAVHFLEEAATGAIIWPARMVLDTLSPPAKYYLHPKPVEGEGDGGGEAAAAGDALLDNAFKGETVMLVTGVPPAATRKALMQWIMLGLEDEDPDLVAAREGVGALETKLAAIDNQIALLPNLAASGTESAAEELEERRNRAQALKKLRDETEQRITTVRARLAAMEAAGADESGAFRLAHGGLTGAGDLRMATWELYADDNEDGRQLALHLLDKRDWASYFLMLPAGYVAMVAATSARAQGGEDDGAGAGAAHGSPQRRRSSATAGGLLQLMSEDEEEHVRVVVGRGAAPAVDGMTAVSMAHVAIRRERHGRGLVRYSDDRGYYGGNFRHGLPHGAGISITAAGRLESDTWRAGRPGGKATMVATDGTTYRGELATVAAGHHAAGASLLHGDEYTEPRAQGRGSTQYVDGSVYEGDFVRGVPCGRGRYRCVTGDIVEGEFDEWGTLHGEGSAAAEDVTRIGIWRRGLLAGFATEIDIHLGTYEGDWEDSLRQGFGLWASNIVDGAHVGSYSLDTRCGRGLLDFSRAKPDSGTDDVDDVGDGKGEGDGDGEGEGDGEEGDPAAAPRSRRGPAAGPRKQPAKAYKATRARVDIPRDGDYRAECRWREGAARAGGVFSHRDSARNPLACKSDFTTDTANPHLPLLDDMRQVEARVAAERARILHTTHRSLLAQCKAREAANARKFAYWQSMAEAKTAAMVAANQRDRAYLSEMRLAMARAKVEAEAAVAGVAGSGGSGGGSAAASTAAAARL